MTERTIEQSLKQQVEIDRVKSFTHIADITVPITITIHPTKVKLTFHFKDTEVVFTNTNLSVLYDEAVKIITEMEKKYTESKTFV